MAGLQLLYILFHALQPIIVPLCFVAAWLLVFTLFYGITTALRDTFSKAKEMHTIPCANCQYFTGDYRLKCTVKPSAALTEEAIACPDYDPYAKVIDNL